MKHRWSIQFRGVKGVAVLTYDDKDRLEAVDISELYDLELHREWIWAWFPREMSGLLAQSNNAKITINAILEDLSFERFWEEYGYKIGKKSRVQLLWSNLSDKDKSKCLLALPRYNYFLANQKGIARLYPETFLSQRRFENEFKTK